MSFVFETAQAHPVAAAAVTGVVGATVLYQAFSDKRKLPPGPAPHPIVGHTFQTPATKIWMWFEELGKQYGIYLSSSLLCIVLLNIYITGPIVRLSLAGDEMVVLNDPKDAEELVSCPCYFLNYYRLLCCP
jgi:hypothetical protein